MSATVLKPRVVAGLPALGWCATVRRDTPTVSLVVGRLVETTDEWFVAGVWDGPYREGGFRDAATMMGSGGRVGDGETFFAAPSNMSGPLYSTRLEDRVVVGNSMAVVLACADDEPDRSYRRYRSDIMSLWRAGLAGSPLTVPTARGRELLIHAGTDVAVDRDLGWRRVTKPETLEPRDFAGYRALLRDSLARLVANGADAARRRPLGTVATLSRGYDSAACAVLGAEVGVRDTLTLEPHGEPELDSGAVVAHALGLRVTALDTQAWREVGGSPAIEFAASPTGQFAALPLAVLEDRYEASVIITGELGDELWERSQQLVGPAVSGPAATLFGAPGLHDFGLRAGVAFVHLPMVGATHAAAIHRITGSDEMRPWSVGGRYDRPIARRILEEAGIPGSAFARDKRAVVALVLTPDLERDFEAFWTATLRSLPRATRWRYRLAARYAPGVLRRAGRMARRLRLQRLGRVEKRWATYLRLPQAYRFHWAVGHLTRRFGAALRVDPDPRRSVQSMPALPSYNRAGAGSEGYTPPGD